MLEIQKYDPKTFPFREETQFEAEEVTIASSGIKLSIKSNPDGSLRILSRCVFDDQVILTLSSGNCFTLDTEGNIERNQREAKSLEGDK